MIEFIDSALNDTETNGTNTKHELFYRITEEIFFRTMKLKPYD